MGIHSRYDRATYENIKRMYEKDPSQAAILLREYIKRYPRDYISYGFYCASLVRNGSVDYADKLMEEIKEKAEEEGNREIINMVMDDYLRVKIKVLCVKKDYKGLKTFLNQNYMKFGSNKYLYVYTNEHIGRNRPIFDSDSYVIRQIKDYSEERLLEHLKKHEIDENENEMDSLSLGVFHSDMNMKELVDEIKKYIPSEKGRLLHYIDEAYYFRYDNCGDSMDGPADYIKVVCFLGTNQIITLYPVSNIYNNLYIDLNYMRKPTNVVKTKRLSQIDKFNKKYNIE